MAENRRIQAAAPTMLAIILKRIKIKWRHHLEPLFGRTGPDLGPHVIEPALHRDPIDRSQRPVDGFQGLTPLTVFHDLMGLLLILKLGSALRKKTPQIIALIEPCFGPTTIIIPLPARPVILSAALSRLQLPLGNVGFELLDMSLHVEVDFVHPTTDLQFRPAHLPEPLRHAIVNGVILSPLLIILDAVLHR